jgi:hypothetical protein
MQNKFVISVFLGVFQLIAVNFAGDRAIANSETCEQVRSVRRLAIKEDLNDESLAKLEYRYCGDQDNINTKNNRGNRDKSSNIVPPANASKNCINLTMVMRLSRIAETNKEHLKLVKSRQIVACELSNQSTNVSSENWSNGQYANWGGSWYYPNGQYAKWGGSWYYPNGQHAKWGNDWYYPNGQYAKWGNDWYYPNGNSTSFEGLISQSCANISGHECREILSKINKNKSDFWRNLSIIELAWKSYNINKDKNQ